MFSIKKTYQMNMDDANTALQNIFAACNTPPNTVPFDKILLQQTAHTKPYDTTLRMIAVLLFLTLILPFVFIGFRQPDNVSPITIKEQYVAGDKLYLKMDFGNHTIKFEEAYLVSQGGIIYEIVSYDTQTLCFPYIAPNCSVYIPYDKNQVLHLQIDLQ